MEFSQRNIERLADLRARFLDANGEKDDYWSSEETLALYDETFAERIGWKWDFALRDLERLDWSLPEGAVLDWGCGTGVASRKVLRSAIARRANSLWLYDRSALAMRFAAKRLEQSFPTLPIAQGENLNATTILVSHVLNELSERDLRQLLERMERATAILWVEPSLKSVSKRLVEIREKLRERFRVVAPCPHQAKCGMLAPENETHWCHHVVKPPQEAFTQSKWAKFAQAMRVDLRDLSLSYLVLDKRPIAPLEAQVKRVIGNARLYKAHASLLVCDETGARACQLLKRDFPNVFKALKKGETPSLQKMNVENGRIVEWRESERDDA